MFFSGVLALFPPLERETTPYYRRLKKSSAFHKGTVFSYGVVHFSLGEVPLCPRSCPFHLVPVEGSL
jgi:hypothetical protein